MDSLQLILLVVCAVACSGFLTSHDGTWNNLRVTWGINPFSSINYASQPLTEADAIHKGFKKISDCGDSSGLHGRRYAKDNDLALILIYDVQGHIAGISAAIPNNLVNSYPSSFLKNHPFVMSGSNYHISAYFVDPSTICSTGRSAAQIRQQGVGTDLYIQNGTDISHSIKIPHKETGIHSTNWTRGKCFPSMGVHYWYNIRKNMSCDEFYPVFLLYNGGQLNAFGWAFQAPMTSPHMEHPPKSTIKAFMSPPPDCIYNAGTLSTLHIYLTNHPETDLC